MTTRPGMMNASPPVSAPARPRSRQAQKIASWVEAGPGSRLQAARASSNSAASSHCRRTTHSSRSSLMWVGGPPNPIHPIRPHSRTIVPRLSAGEADAERADAGCSQARAEPMRAEPMRAEPARAESRRGDPAQAGAAGPDQLACPEANATIQRGSILT